MRSRKNGKLNNKNGFSLSEVLVAIIILALATAVVAGGIPAAFRAFNAVQAKSNAQLLMSTTLSILRDEIGSSNEVTVDSANKTVTYRSNDTGCNNMISFTQDGVVIQEYCDSQNKPAQRNLVSSRASSNCVFTCTSIALDTANNCITLNAINVKSGSLTDAAKLASYSVRILN